MRAIQGAMTLLDEWEHGDLGTLGGPIQTIAGVGPDDGLDDFPGSPTGAAEPGICSLEIVDRQLARFAIQQAMLRMQDVPPRLCWCSNMLTHTYACDGTGPGGG